jgi:hypothetical protein
VLNLTSGADPETMATWQDGSHSPVFLVSAAGLYSLTHANGCGSKADTIVVGYQASPMPFSLGPDVVLCPGDSVILQAPMTSDPLLWQDGTNTPEVVARQSQVYALTIINNCGSQYDEVLVSVDEEIPVIPFDDMMICPGEVLTLDVTQSFVAQYAWSTGTSGPAIEIHSPGEYMVTVSTICYTVSNTAHVEAAEDCSPDIHLYVPNVFSPDGDQVNDDFQIYFEQGMDVMAFKGEIFDRWGSLI